MKNVNVGRVLVVALVCGLVSGILSGVSNYPDETTCHTRLQVELEQNVDLNATFSPELLSMVESGEVTRDEVCAPFPTTQGPLPY